MLFETIFAFFTNPVHFSVLIVSWTLALITFLYWRENGNVALLHSHLFFFLAPLLDFAITVPCSVPFVQGLLSFCSVVITRTIIFAIPVALLLAVVIGYWIAPRMYKSIYKSRRISRKDLDDLTKMAGLSKIKYWVLDTAKPVAFSFGKNVLISVGMYDILNKKEQEAVLLHELGHVKNRSSLSKFSLWLTRLFSPVAHFASLKEKINDEEQTADDFAAKIQGTRRHLASAKHKVVSFI